MLGGAEGRRGARRRDVARRRWLLHPDRPARLRGLHRRGRLRARRRGQVVAGQRGRGARRRGLRGARRLRATRLGRRRAAARSSGVRAGGRVAPAPAQRHLRLAACRAEVLRATQVAQHGRRRHYRRGDRPDVVCFNGAEVRAQQAQPVAPIELHLGPRVELGALPAKPIGALDDKRAGAERLRALARFDEPRARKRVELARARPLVDQDVQELHGLALAPRADHVELAGGVLPLVVGAHADVGEGGELPRRLRHDRRGPLAGHVALARHDGCPRSRSSKMPGCSSCPS